jgi:hypothetical protein
MRFFLFILSFLFISKIFGQSPLCASRPTNFCCEYVSSVTINGKTFAGSTGFSSSSGGSPAGYYDYTYTKDTVPRIKAGQSISISYTGVTNGNYMEYFKLWIDFNGNGILTDAGELVHSSNYSWLGTKTITATFTVPTSVYNGDVYMRFVMQYSGSPTICGTYPYGNTFDFKTTITGAKDPFKYSGFVYNSEGNGISNVPVKLYYKTKSSSTYTLYSTNNTGTDGKYSFTTTYDTTVYDFQLQINGLTVSNPSFTDAKEFNKKIFSANYNSKDYYRMDVNNDSRLNISDVFSIFMKINGNSWSTGIPSYYLFTQTEWNTISTSTSNLKSTYSGYQSITLNGLKTNGSSVFYLIKTGQIQ